MEQQVRRGQLATQGRKDLRGHKGLKVLQVRRDLKEYRDYKATTAPLAQQDHKV